MCERYDVPLVRAFSRLTEESARHLDTRHTAFMRLATRPEAMRAAEHIGLERRFVAGRFAHRHSVSRPRTRTTSDSVTHTSGRTEGGATTHTVGTTTGQAHTETEVPRHEPQVHVHIEDHRPQPEQRGDRRGADGPDLRAGAGGREPSRGDGRAADKGTGKNDGDGVRGTAQRRTADPRPRDRAGAGRGSGGSGGNARKRPAAGQGGSTKSGKPIMDIAKSRTWFTARHESDATTKSWSTTEETSHTRSTSHARTDGVSVGDEISYELVYDHRVQPETLMALPEDQLLAPHVSEAPAGAGTAVTAGATRPGTDSKLVALVIDPAAVGSALVAPVRPGEIPAFEPPAPAVSAHVPDYQQVPRPAIDAGE